MGIEITSWKEDQLLEAIKNTVTTKLSPVVHIQKFYSLAQNEGENCQDYLQRLRARASSCGFLCPSCSEDISEEHVKFKFVLGLKQKIIQTAVLKTEAVKPGTKLTDLLREALTIEQSIRDQEGVTNETVCNIENIDQEEVCHIQNKNHQKANARPCRNCGNKFSPGHVCPAKHVKCHHCGLMGHFQKVCRSKTRYTRNAGPSKYNRASISTIEDEDASIGSLEMHVNAIGDSSLTEILVSIEAKLKGGVYINKQVSVLPDTGANICLIGPHQVRALGIKINDLDHWENECKVAGGMNIGTSKKFQATITLRNRKAKATIYFSKNINRFYLSKQACINLGIVPASFPYPTDQDQCNSVRVTSNNLSGTPARPSVLPVAPDEENIPKLRKILLESFAKTAFNRQKPFPKLSTPPAQIHLRENYVIPKPAYQPAVVAEHWAERVKQSLDRDVEAGILCKVPFNEPTIWCSRMVLVKKKDGSPRRTVDYQKLNKQCVREPVYSASPFHTARQIPQHTWKSVLDAVDGYHSVEIDEPSSKLTTFITPWGRYRYLRFPQGHCSAGDAFNGRVQEILQNVPRFVRIVDDICLYDYSIHDMFFHTWDLLETCARNGIVLNESKFQFCKKTVDFAGLAITAESVQPSNKTLAAIQNFPPPTDLTKARAFFGLVNQVQWAYANSQEMTPFRDLVKPKSTFIWTEELKTLFAECKEKILAQVKDGVKHFDLDRITCLQTDFSQAGLGYLLLQKYCKCSLDSAPVCCVEGWRLIFAGSRFTKGAETRYAPTEGELLAVAWSLNHSHIFTKGSPNLVAVTDHKPLLGILNEKPLNDIKNPRIVRLKEQTLSFNFTIQYNRGKWQRGPDALSRSPQCSSLQLFGIESEEDFCGSHLDEQYLQAAIAELNEINGAISLEDIKEATEKDEELSILSRTIQQSFPETHNLTNPLIRQYFPVRNDLMVCEGGLIMFQDRMVIPKSLRGRILETLHSAHQGVDGMRARARNTVYWPGLNAAIKQKRDNCSVCNKIAPSQAREPIQMLPHPEFPFQYICMDAFQMQGKDYLAAVDKFSGWILIYRCKSNVNSATVISKLRAMFEAYGVAEKLYTDGGLNFTSSLVESFLKRWKVEHVVSSAFYPQGNGRAELAVKTAKRILQENTGPGGTLDDDKVARALLQYRNTPIKAIGYSPAQLLFNRNLRDCLPAVPTQLKLNKQWILSADEREKLFERRNSIMASRYNQSTKPLQILSEGSNVQIQDFKDLNHQGSWNKYGTILERSGRKYTIRVSGSAWPCNHTQQEVFKVSHSTYNQGSPNSLFFCLYVL